MNAAVLVLDVGMRPLRVEPWQRAICDLFLGKVEVVEYSRDRTIQGATREWPLPSVVRCRRHFKREKIRVKFSRINIYARDGFTCQYCGTRCVSEDLTFDHVVPRSRGGRTTWENVVSCCVPCNRAKADGTPVEAGVRLRSRPRKPTYLPSITVRMSGPNIPAEWAPYWTITLDG
jgi:5-methylcytosine-specific restriction endonuclease McrA